jgi:hypothetical protein
LRHLHILQRQEKIWGFWETKKVVYIAPRACMCQQLRQPWRLRQPCGASCCWRHSYHTACVGSHRRRCRRRRRRRRRCCCRRRWRGCWGRRRRFTGAGELCVYASCVVCCCRVGGCRCCCRRSRRWYLSVCVCVCVL